MLSKDQEAELMLSKDQKAEQRLNKNQKAEGYGLPDGEP
jgi:hypothetical protein